MSNGAILLLMTALFLGFGYMGVPVAFALMAGVLVACGLTPISMQSMVGQMFHGIDSEILLAVPFFLLVGELMTSANVTNRMIRLAQTMVGHMRGGLAQVVTLFSMFFAGISGSSTADVAVLSRTVAPGDDQRGLRPRLHGGADRLRLDDGEPDPAEHHGGGLRRDRQRLDRRAVPGRGRARRADRHRAHDLLAFLRAGRRQEAARELVRVRRRGARLGAAADDPGDHHGRHPDRLVHSDRGRAWSRRSISCSCWCRCSARGHIRHLPRDFVYTGLLYSIPLALVAAASAFGWMLAYLRGPDIVVGLDRAHRRHTTAASSCSCWCCSSSIIGDFMDAVPAIIIFMPIIIKLTELGDINPLHMGVVIITTLVFGLITPPYGLSLLVASKFVGVAFSRAMFASLPIYVVFFVTIAFTVLFPDVVLCLPKLLLPESVGCFKSPSGTGYICPK